jgi:hypothetical protein
MPVPMIEANQFGVRFANNWCGQVNLVRGASVMLMFFSLPGW